VTGAVLKVGAGRRLERILIGLIVVLAIGSCSLETRSGPTVAIVKNWPADPLDSTYWIDGREIRLRDGRFEMPAAPGSAAKITVSVFDTPAFGYLEGDGEIDAAVILVYQGGGSGTFYYIAAALNRADGYEGTNAVLLGDRVMPHAVRIENRVIIADFSDRARGEPMAARPTIDVTKHLYLDGDRLLAVPADSEESGWVTFGHEVRSFLPCNRETEHWVLGRSPAISDIESTYRGTMTDARPYAPLFMVLTGSFDGPKTEGFGTDYADVFFATRVIAADPAGHCRREFIHVESPSPSMIIESPLSLRGRARGIWFFEGDFPVVLEDQDGSALATGFVTAKDEWMTEDFVPFSGTLTFTRPRQGDRGTLIFKKDNPTDRPELDDSTAIPVFFED
jgi:hypothetical protein